MNRRRYIAVGGTVVATALAGCVSELGTGDDDENGDDGNGDDDNGDENGTDDEGTGDEKHDAVRAFESYMDAAQDEDLETVSELTHTANPFDPLEMAEAAEEDEDTTFTFEGDHIVDYEVELADEAYDPEDVHDHPYAEFWFEDVDLDEHLEGEEAALVAVETEIAEDGEQLFEEDTQIMLTEDGEWRHFFEYTEPPEIPDDEPVDDRDPIEGLEFDVDEERVTIDIDQSTDADEVIAYSSSLETESSVYRPDEDDGDGRFPANWFTSGFDPEGDEIVVTILVDGEELVVHREAYEP